MTKTLRGGILLITCIMLSSACSKDPEPSEEKDMAQATEDMKTSDERDLKDPVDEPDMKVAEDMKPAGDMKVEIEPDMKPATEAQSAILGVEQGERIELPGLESAAHVVFTEMGRPHIYAKNRNDLGYVLGYVVARDRFFVMDLQRRLAQGTLSEILGDAALPSDVDARLLGMDHTTDLVLAGLSDEDRAYMESYVNGINKYIADVEAGDAEPPSELKSFKFLLGIRKETDVMHPFTLRDIAAMVTVIMYETNFEGGDVGRAARYNRLDSLYDDADALVDLRRAGAREDAWGRGSIKPVYEAPSTPGFGIEEGNSGRTGLKARPGAKRDLDARSPSRFSLQQSMLDRSAERLDLWRIKLGRREADNFGSNTWAVAGSKTEDGFGLVAGDGHLPLSVPALMYQIGMDTTVFGEGDIQQTGLLITSLPVLAVGTNGKVAWSQVNPVADITDWYAERIELTDGVPTASFFQGEYKPLVATEESYEIAEVAALQSEERTEKWTRYQTFDGRWLYDIEGTEYSDLEDVPDGAKALNFGGRYVVPEDLDNSGFVEGVSFDYTAFDATKYVGALEGFTKAQNVRDFQEATKGLIGNMLYSAVTDHEGSILFTSYQAVPCRTYLPREDDGSWMDGANPTMLLDGTTYGAFSIPSLPDGKVDESHRDDPYRCVVPFDETPQSINPDSGYVFNGNNQPAPITLDGRLDNDPWYIGGPWASFRGYSIEERLKAATADGNASVQDMADIQADRISRTGQLFVPTLLEAIAKAKLAAAPGAMPATEHEQRLAALYAANVTKFDAIAQRMQDWSDAGYDTPSGVETFYNTPTEQERVDAVATMIFNAWMPRVLNKIFGDEQLQFQFSGSYGRLRTLMLMLASRGENTESLASYNDETGESVFFDILSTPEVERSDEVFLLALVEAIAFLESDPTEPGSGGFGTEDMDAWLWGLRHQVRFESLLADFLEGTEFGSFLDPFSITTDQLPLAADLTEDDPRFGLKWFPRPGDNYGVDAANPGWSGTRFTHGSGPVMRMVIGLKDGEVKGHNIIPGGQSGINDSPHFADQAAFWLENKTVPLRFYPEQVAEGGVSRTIFVPADADAPSE